MTLSSLQKYVKKQDYKGKKSKIFLKLIEEVGELSEMIKKDRRLDPEDERSKAIKGTLEEELADVLYWIAALANVHDIDLEEVFLRKQEYNDRNK